MVHRWIVNLLFCLILICHIYDVSNDDVFVKENSSILLVCPILEEKTSIVWRGPPNLTIYKAQQSPTGLKLVSDNNSDILIGEEGITLKAKCYVKDGLPEPTLYLSYQEQVVNATNTSMLEYTFVPTKDDHLDCFTCSAVNEVVNVQTSILLFVQGQPECLHDNNRIASSINDDTRISFNVYNPSGHLNLKCLDNMYNTFVNCSIYNLQVQDNNFSIQSCNRSFLVAGYVIRVPVSAKHFRNVEALVINLENKYGIQNCTFNFQIEDNSSSQITVSSLLIYTVICGLCAVLFCLAKCILKHVRYRIT